MLFALIGALFPWTPQAGGADGDSFLNTLTCAFESTCPAASALTVTEIIFLAPTPVLVGGHLSRGAKAFDDINSVLSLVTGKLAEVALLRPSEARCVSSALLVLTLGVCGREGEEWIGAEFRILDVITPLAVDGRCPKIFRCRGGDNGVWYCGGSCGAGGSSYWREPNARRIMVASL